MGRKTPRQVRPAQLYNTLTQEMNRHLLPKHPVQEPTWYKVLHQIPPSEISTRTIPFRHHAASNNVRRAKGVFKPQQIVHEEDGLRQTFYKDHPWELARPRIIIEVDGKDGRRSDWSTGPRQPGIALTGECVVQRQLWLMHNTDMTKDQAYDAARREFYALRQEEEIERRVAREEARYVGAYFGKNKLAISQDIEDQQFEHWKSWASTAVTQAEAARTASYADYGGEEGLEEGAEAKA